MQKISRRQFLSLCAGAVVLGGGWVLARGRILPELRDRTAAALGRGACHLSAADRRTGQRGGAHHHVAVSRVACRARRGIDARRGGGDAAFPAEEEAFTEDGVTVYLYTAQVTGLERGARYRYRVAAGEERGGWTPLQADDGGAFRALIFPDSQSSDYAGMTSSGKCAKLCYALPGNGSKEYDRRYYSFDYGPVHFLVLDTQQGEEQERHPHITEAQEAWFRSDVQRTRQPWKVVLMHKDPLQYRIHGRPERGEGFSEEGKLWMPLFDAAGIDLVLSAHLHTYRNRGHIKGFERSAEGSLYVLTGVAGDVRYPGLWVDHAVDEVVAPQPETDNYLTLDADEDMLIVRCFLPDGTQIDEAAVKKT